MVCSRVCSAHRMFAHSLHKRCKASENSLLIVYSLYDQEQKKFTHEVPIMTKKFTQSLHTLFKNVQKVYTEQTGVNRCKLRPKFAQACPPMVGTFTIFSKFLQIRIYWKMFSNFPKFFSKITVIYSKLSEKPNSIWKTIGGVRDLGSERPT